MAEAPFPAGRSSLAAETGPVDIAVGGLLLVEGGAGTSVERVSERVEDRLHLVPRFALARAPPADLKRAGRGRGATVNDALLAAVAGMLRRYLEVAVRRPVKPLVALNPGTQGLSVGIVSYEGTVRFGLLADRDLQPPVEVACDAQQAALAELT